MNDKEQFILNIMNSLVIADTKTISEILSAKGIWPADKAYANVYKYLSNLEAIGKLEKHPGFWRKPGCVSTYQDHAKALTQSLSTILKTPYEVVLYREKKIQEISIILDCICFLKKDDFGRVFCFEEVRTETDSYLEQKVNTLKHWEGILGYLSKLTGYLIPHFDIVTEDLKDYLEAL